MPQTVTPKLHKFPLSPEMQGFDYIAEGTKARACLDDIFGKPEFLPSDVLSSADNQVYIYRADQFPGRNFKSVTAAYAVQDAVNKAQQTERELRFTLATAGSYGMGVGLATQGTGASVRVFTPTTTNPYKLQAMRQLGMEVMTVPGVFDDALRASKSFAREQDAVHLHPFANPANIAATAAIGVNMYSRVPNMTHFEGQVGGGSFFAGVAGALHALDKSIQLSAVQVEGVDPFMRSLRRGEPVEVDEKYNSLMCKLGGVGVRATDPMTLGAGSRVVDEVATVEYREVLAVMHELNEELGVLPEFAGAAGAARARRLAKFSKLSGAVIICAVTGANADEYPEGRLEHIAKTYRAQEAYDMRNLHLLR